MWSSTFIVSTLLAVAHTAWADRTLSVNPGGPMIPACPTITTTAKVCPTCITHPCDVVSTVINPGNCPRKIPTVTKKYPCAKSTCPGGCKTHYVYPSTLATTTTTPCPTVTEVQGRCSTCVVAQCELLSVISSVCGCPSVVPTHTTRYECDGTCPGGCAGTQYVYDTAKPTCTGTY
ncbi:hypothetical protein B0T10DRAFT_80142 [Thelonectria olida]|uniref:Uncharacterized protein n=1 Tax=Thelonectria olida TaxID=1576542 RepID=A0A9P8W3N4_9HYPO|nr:hypothetical protein B0T10DRAFT_80142 [Thelonectria olida]